MSQDKNLLKVSEKLIKYVFLAISIVGIYYFDLKPSQYVEFISNQNNYNRIIAISDILADPQISSETSVLPTNIKDKIGNASIAVYPWEQSLMAYNTDLNFTIMPLMQAYTAYTPYLDETNAKFFENKETAPSYLIFNTATIDERLTGIECPATWNAIYSNYIAVAEWDNYLLLQRQQENVTRTPEILCEEICLINQAIDVPSYHLENELLFSADFELTAWGKVRKLLYQIPEVTMTVHFESGKSYTGRIIPENLCNDFPISSYSSNLQDCGLIFNGICTYKSEDAVISVEFGGPGLQYYKKDVNCRFAEISKKSPVSYWGNTIEMSEFQQITANMNPVLQTLTYCLDSVNTQLYDSSTQAVHADSNDYLMVSGWFIDERRKMGEADLYLVLGNRRYLLVHTIRSDVGPALSLENVDNCGFWGMISPEDLPIGTFTPQLMIVYPSGEYSTVSLRENSIILE